MTLEWTIFQGQAESGVEAQREARASSAGRSRNCNQLGTGGCGWGFLEVMLPAERGEMGWGVGVSISCVCPYLLPMPLPWKPSRLSLALLRSAPSSWDCARDVEVEHELLQMSPRSFQVPPTNSRFFQLTLCSVSLRGFRLSPGHLGLCPGGHCCSPQAVRGILPRSGFEFQSLF